MKKNKVNKFRLLIKENRVLLASEGYSKATIDSWIYTNRVPEYETACKISALLGVVLTKIPYYKMERTL